MINKKFLLLSGSFLLVFLIVSVTTLQGCSSILYYQQAIGGQYEILNRRVEIETLINNEDTPEKLKNKLKIVLQVRAFSKQNMAMSVDSNYSQYSDLQRDYVVWNVSASPELSLSSHQWCYPIVGCQSYRGYFHQDMAEEEASELQQQGYDTWVGGVSAYSTLGWFEDPVLNTFIFRNDADLAALLIHELSHQILYIKGDTAFNESFATAVEIEGLKRWLKKVKQEELLTAYQKKREEKAFFIETVSATTTKLKTLYDSALSDNDKKNQKEQIISTLKDSYKKAVTEKSLQGYYAHWFDEVNNAKLAAISNYYNYVPAFSAMIADANGDMAIFYMQAKALGEKDKKIRDKLLNEYLLQNKQSHAVIK
jgi:predicted aminopeptidase